MTGAAAISILFPSRLAVVLVFYLLRVKGFETQNGLNRRRSHLGAWVHYRRPLAFQYLTLRLLVTRVTNMLFFYGCRRTDYAAVCSGSNFFLLRFLGSRSSGEESRLVALSLIRIALAYGCIFLGSLFHGLSFSFLLCLFLSLGALLERVDPRCSGCCPDRRPAAAVAALAGEHRAKLVGIG